VTAFWPQDQPETRDKTIAKRLRSVQKLPADSLHEVRGASRAAV